ncbi:hypothetical protein Nepgr_033230 [Nepenthes gracilis]|uniref:AB hydrolase-1 domain-containing protein n=1 Tax=Nepenthes gracilis TaxID=150966 RepID=A0AAD3TL13_NEPGR|nr:hypothetical protein Nepgr_033230 [Nepenthes gracilis]
MTRRFSIVRLQDRYFRSTFVKSGLRSTVTDLGDGTVMHCWAPKVRKESKPNLLLIHGFGANGMWQWFALVPRVTSYFNVYVPDLLFFGGSFTTRPERSESFQAECVMRVMEANSVREMSVVGLSYGGYVAYSMAVQYAEVVKRVVICCSGVCVEENDFRKAMFKAADLDGAADILLPQTAEKLRELLSFTIYKPPKFMPTCFLNDFIDVMCRQYAEEKRELLYALLKDRKISEIPKITQPTLIIWGDQDQVFPLELAHRLKRHLGDTAQLVVIKDAGHSVHVERAKEFYRNLKAFLLNSHPPPLTHSHSLASQDNYGNTGSQNSESRT